MVAVIIDVREPDEYAAEHVEGAVNVPLSSFDRQGPALVSALRQPVTLMCRGGKRASLAAQALQQAGVQADVTVYPGGILEWKKQGQAVVAGGGSRRTLPIMRQVQMIAGLLVVASLALAWLVDPRWAALAAFVGLGLTMAGATGFCGLAMLLARMPWNQAPKSAPATGQASPPAAATPGCCGGACSTQKTA